MDTLEKEDDSLWSELEADFEKQETTPLKIDLGKPPTKRRTFTVANQQSLFSGFYPMLAICLMAAVVGQPLINSIFGWSAWLLVFPLAAALAPLLRDPKRGLWFYGMIGVLAGGVAHLGTSLLEIGVYQMGGGRVDPLSLVVLLQKQLHRFFTPQHWIFYVLGGVFIGALTIFWKRRLPWMDSPPSKRFHLIVASFLLMTPLLIPLSSVIAGQVFYREPIHWFTEIDSAHPEVREQISWSVDEDAWRLFLKRTSSLLGSVADSDARQDKIATLPVRELQAMEAEFLTLLGQETRPAWSTWDCRVLENALLSRRRDLKTSQTTIWSIVERGLWEQSQGGGEHDLCRLLDHLLIELSESELSPTETVEWLGRIQQLEGQLHPVLEGMDLKVFYSLNLWAGRDQTPSPLKVFGVPLTNSPTQVWFQYEYSWIVQTWLDFRASLQGLEPAQQLEKLQDRVDNGDQSKGFEFSLLTSLSEHRYGLELSPQLQAAEVILMTQQYRQRQGEWPTDVSDLSEQLSFQSGSSRWEFSEKGGVLTIRDQVLSIPRRVLTDARTPAVETPGEWTLQ